MSNLGMYQRIVVLSKRLGGPLRFIFILAFGGYIVGKGVEITAKKAVELIKRHKSEKEDSLDSTKTFTVCKTVEIDDEGHELSRGTHFNVLERDKDAVLIKIIGDNNNPYLLSEVMLLSISDYVR